MSSPYPSITEDALVEFVAQVGGVTFVEIMEHFGPNAQGRRVVTLGGDPNLVLWPYVSSELEIALIQAVAHDRIYSFPTHPILYSMDGQMCTFPLARTTKPFHYRTPHWIPVEFSTWKHLTAKQRQSIRNA
jgi:hypothetical protein